MLSWSYLLRVVVGGAGRRKEERGKKDRAGQEGKGDQESIGSKRTGAGMKRTSKGNERTYTGSERKIKRNES